jgi:RimJ/RimL family protein N-acetyltransferase
MFIIEPVSLRPLELTDLDTLYAWDTDISLSYYSGWISRLSHSALNAQWERRISEPPDTLVSLGIEVEHTLVGYIQLAHIDLEERRAEIGIVIGDPAVYGKGIGSTAVRILCDYAFTVKGLARVFAYTYGFNQRAQRMFLRAGFQPEGVLRQHEIHNGVRQDMHAFGMLRDEFYAQHATIFKPIH